MLHQAADHSYKRSLMTGDSIATYDINKWSAGKYAPIAK